jgi:hypothetical protein
VPTISSFLISPKNSPYGIRKAKRGRSASHLLLNIEIDLFYLLRFNFSRHLPAIGHSIIESYFQQVL